MPCHEKAWKFKCSLLQNKEPFQTKNKYKLAFDFQVYSTTDALQSKSVTTYYNLSNQKATTIYLSLWLDNCSLKQMFNIDH